MTALIIAIYCLLLVIAVLNLLLIPRISGKSTEVHQVAFLIPARNEAGKIGGLVKSIKDQGAKVYVYDDASEDGTAEEASINGATVIRGSGPPEGWTGKNNACYQLAKAVAEDFGGKWIMFVDADVTFKPNAVQNIAGALSNLKPNIPVWTAFPRMRFANLLEAIYTCWVPFTLLALNPFFLNRLGVNTGFTNGQLTAWRADAYWEIKPHEQVKGEVLEDVLIGRMLAKAGKRVAVAVAPSSIEVAMYDSLKEAYRGMLKNSGQVAGYGSIPFAIFLFAVAFGWIALGTSWLIGATLLIATMAATVMTLRGPFWLPLFAPVSVLCAGVTVIASVIARKRGVDWKGRVYKS